MTNAPRKVLLVDDDRQFLQVLGETMASWSQGNWQIFTASSLTECFSLLQKHAMELAVLDIQMPIVDGVQFLALLQRKFPQMRKVILTGSTSNEQIRLNCLAGGADLFLEKPASSDGLQNILAAFQELLHWEPEQEGFRGVLRRVGLHDVIQMECLSRHSLILDVSAGLGRGQIYIRDGNIIHAQIGEQTGQAAFNSILALKGGEFSFRPFAEPPAVTIEGSWEFLVMEASRQSDEQSGALEPLAEPPAPDILPESVFPVSEDRLPAVAPALESGSMRSPAIHAMQQDASVSEPPPKFTEFLVCSAQGDMLFECGCSRVEERISLMELLSHKARQIARGLPVGPIDRIELQEARSRLLVQLRPDRGVLLRSLTRRQPTAPGDMS